jgi:hypothetical protein
MVEPLLRLLFFHKIGEVTMAIANDQIGLTETTLLTASAETAVLNLIMCNTTSSTVKVTVYVYASGGSAADDTTFIKDLEVAPYDTFIWAGSEKFILDTGGVISAVADTATALTITTTYKVLG